MARGDLLNSIWRGEVIVREKGNETALALLLDSVLNVPTVGLIVTSGLASPMAYSDSDNFLPGCPLGDILSEELGFDIPLNSVILFEPLMTAEAKQVSPRELGQQLGSIVSSITRELPVYARSPTIDSVMTRAVISAPVLTQQEGIDAKAN